MYRFIHYSLHITATSLVLPYTLAHYVTGTGLGMRWGVTFMYVHYSPHTKSMFLASPYTLACYVTDKGWEVGVGRVKDTLHN